MLQSLALHSCAYAGLAQHVDCALLQDTRAHAILDMVASMTLDHHRLNSLQVQQMSQHQTGGTSSYDSDLCANRAHFLLVRKTLRKLLHHFFGNWLTLGFSWLTRRSHRPYAILESFDGQRFATEQ